MKRSLLVLLVIASIMSVPTQAKDKRDWQTGKVLDTDEARRYAGNIGNGSSTGTLSGNGTYSGSTTSSSTAIYRVYETYVIELGDYVYVAQERLRWRWSKGADLTVNAPVKVAIEKKTLYVLGEDGKEHEAEITKKILKAE